MIRSVRGVPPPILIVLAFWVLAPFVLTGRLAQDAVPFVAAGEIARSGGVVYTSSGDLFTLEPEFAEASCDASPAATDCANENVAFVSPPAALPVAVLTSVAGATGGVLLLRVAAAVALAAGVLEVRRRLVAHDRSVDGWFLWFVLLLTPTFMVPLALGQTSPLMFLSAAIGLSAVGRSGRAASMVGVLWGVTVAIKLTPAVLVLVLLARRRWHTLAVGVATVVALALMGLPFGGPQAWADFVDASRALEAGYAANPYNGSLEALGHALAPGASTGTAFDVAVWGVRLAAFAGLLVVGRRVADEDAQWGFAWLGSLVLVPLVWWHYLWVAFAAAAAAMVVTTRRSVLVDPRLLLVAAGVSLPLSLVNGTGSSVPWAQALFLLVALVWVGWMAASPTSPPATPALPIAAPGEDR